MVRLGREGTHLAVFSNQHDLGLCQRRRRRGLFLEDHAMRAMGALDGLADTPFGNAQRPLASPAENSEGHGPYPIVSHPEVSIPANHRVASFPISARPALKRSVFLRR